MTGKILCWIISFGCAILFYAIGVYAQKREKPMWFWSGTEINTDRITDVPQYNKENGRMWKLYALWYFAAGLAGTWSLIAFLVILILSCTVGLVLLIRSYSRIFQKYSVQ